MFLSCEFHMGIRTQIVIHLSPSYSFCDLSSACIFIITGGSSLRRRLSFSCGLHRIVKFIKACRVNGPWWIYASEYDGKQKIVIHFHLMIISNITWENLMVFTFALRLSPFSSSSSFLRKPQENDKYTLTVVCMHFLLKICYACLLGKMFYIFSTYFIPHFFFNY